MLQPPLLAVMVYKRRSTKAAEAIGASFENGLAETRTSWKEFLTADHSRVSFQNALTKVEGQCGCINVLVMMDKIDKNGSMVAKI
jgi:hypothetical protein